jgi:hypothetical protein
MNHLGERRHFRSVDEQDGFFYDVLHLQQRRAPKAQGAIDGRADPAVRGGNSRAGVVERLPGFKRRLNGSSTTAGPHRERRLHAIARQGKRRLLSVVTAEQLRRVLGIMLDEAEFLSPYGVRALSRCSPRQPYVFEMNGARHGELRARESSTGLFGGNSNWRGPIWFPVNYLLIEALQKFHHYYGDEFTVECPARSGQYLTLEQVAAELSRRLTRIFLREGDGGRPVHGSVEKYAKDPHGATSCCSTNTSTATTGRVWAPATKRAGPDSSRNYCNNRACRRRNGTRHHPLRRGHLRRS